jgi:hypothetical protein
MPKGRFKLTFRSTETYGEPSGMQRALIIAVAPTPHKDWLEAVLACEDGTMQKKMISTADFALAERKQVAMLEIEGEAAPVLYGPERTLNHA